ncbi:ABC transporter permease [Microbispora triticiradicis]|uniref:ABC transporter permease n=1 Tax=Microbispora triticiradicis TaxID=2200763 RepID=UPI001AD6638E|nr:ABC transporter permease [Microbispora triticiradicis]MBO4273324.1 ABC transporter permease subunit [Microbispora triticiradicis]
MKRAGLFARGRVSRLPQAWRRPLAVVGTVVTLAWIVVALAAPVLAPHDPLAQELPRLVPPGPGHWLGTDQLGRDVLSRIMYGARVSIPLTLLLVALSVVVGGLLGACAGYFGRWVDETIMRLADLVFAFPTVILAMVVAAALGASLGNAVLAVLVVAWPAYARVTRGLVLGVREREFVLSGRLLGFSAWRSLRVDVLPNVTGPVLVLATLDIGTALLLLSGLSFLGLGAKPPSPEWGAMVAAGVDVFDSWWVATFPGLAILTVVLGFNFLGDTLRDALDPRTAGAIKERAL